MTTSFDSIWLFQKYSQIEEKCYYLWSEFIIQLRWIHIVGIAKLSIQNWSCN